MRCIYINESFVFSRQRKRLQKELGKEAVLSLIDLWLMAAEQRPNGVLRGFDVKRIEASVEWQGQPGTFVTTLLEIGYLNKDQDGVYSLQDWSARQDIQ